MYNIHGDKIIRRRKNHPQYITVESYSKILKEDFHNMCGYCGKDFDIIPCEKQKDHLIPKEEAKKHNREELITDYKNLVYSCRVCNRNKWDRWPLNTIDKLNDGTVGYVDPASSEYNKHLKRNLNGEIVACTEVGEYMYGIFNFKNRLTEVWWKMGLIKKNIEEIDKLLESKESLPTYRQYRDLINRFNDFCKQLRCEKEML